MYTYSSTVKNCHRSTLLLSCVHEHTTPNNLISVSSAVLKSLDVHLRTKHDRMITNVTKNCSHANKLFAIPSASQYLYAQCRVECNNFSYYMAKPVLSKFVRCNWFLLCQDFAAKPLPWKWSKPYTFFWSKANIFKIYNQTANQDEYFFLFQ